MVRDDPDHVEPGPGDDHVDVGFDERSLASPVTLAEVVDFTGSPQGMRRVDGGSGWDRVFGSWGQDGRLRAERYRGCP